MGEVCEFVRENVSSGRETYCKTNVIVNKPPPAEEKQESAMYTPKTVNYTNSTNVDLFYDILNVSNKKSGMWDKT